MMRIRKINPLKLELQLSKETISLPLSKWKSPHLMIMTSVAVCPKEIEGRHLKSPSPRRRSLQIVERLYTSTRVPSDRASTQAPFSVYHSQRHGDEHGPGRGCGSAHHLCMRRISDVDLLVAPWHTVAARLWWGLCLLAFPTVLVGRVVAVHTKRRSRKTIVALRLIAP